MACLNLKVERIPGAGESKSEDRAHTTQATSRRRARIGFQPVSGWSIPRMSASPRILIVFNTARSGQSYRLEAHTTLLSVVPSDVSGEGQAPKGKAVHAPSLARVEPRLTIRIRRCFSCRREVAYKPQGCASWLPLVPKIVIVLELALVLGPRSFRPLLAY
jgi:hypothetical protein